LSNTYFIVVGVIFLEIAASWDVYGRGDVGGWACAVIVVAMVDIYVLNTQRERYEEVEGLSTDTEATNENDSLLPRTRYGTSSNGRSRQSSGASSGLGGGENEERQRLLSQNVDCKCNGLRGRSKHGKAIKNDYTRSFEDAMKSILHALNELLKVLALVVSCFLLHGALIHGLGTQHHAPHEGNFLTFTVQNQHGESVNKTVYYWCSRSLADQGHNHTFYQPETNDTTDSPVFILENDLAYGMADWLGLFAALRIQGHRVCIWDKPGVGFSFYATKQDLIPSSYYGAFLEALNKTEYENFPAPYSFVAEGVTGVQMVLGAAQSHPEMVKEILLLNPLLPDFEARAHAEIEELNSMETRSLVAVHRRQKIRSTVFLNAIGVPFGLVPYLTDEQRRPNVSSWTEVDANEQRWNGITEKTWILELWMNDERHAPKNLVAKVPSDIPVHVIGSNLTESQITDGPCKKLSLDENQCEILIAEEKIALDEKLNFVQNGGIFVACDFQECGLDSNYLVYQSPNATVTLIKHILQLK